MQRFPAIRLKPRKARPFFGRHPWTFAGAIDRVDGNPKPGDQVRLVSNEGQFVAYGLFNPHSNIRVRLYSWDEERPFDASMIVERIGRAVRFRHEDLGLGDPRAACRLVYSESDGLSGLIVDRYADFVVVQFTSLAMAQHRQTIVEVLEDLLHPNGIYGRTERGIGEQEGLDSRDGPLAGAEPIEPVVIVENGLEFEVDARTGQKTGAFLDQRDNRRALCRYTAGKSLLDAFCYGAGFAITAAKKGGASSVVGIDVSGPALQRAQRNADRNEVAAEFIKGEAATVLQQLARDGRRFGVVVTDPPKFARTAGALDRALKGYEHINRQALELLEPGGILLACSCSGHVTRPQFLQVLIAASRKADRELHFLEQRGQAPDHPVSASCLETEYLKCVIARCVPN